MGVFITSRNSELDPATRERIEKKADKMRRYFDRIQDVEVTVDQEKHRQLVEVVLHCDGVVVQARKTGEDLLLALDGAFDKAQRQIKRWKNRMIDTRRRSGSRRMPVRETIVTLPEAVDEDQPPPVFEKTSNGPEIEVEHRELLALTPEEASMHLDLSGAAFFVFLNVENNHINVIHHRADGRCGLIEPVIE